MDAAVRARKSVPIGQILTDEPVGVLVEPTLPGMVGVGEVALGDSLMAGELLAVVIGERVDKVGMRLQCCEQGVCDGLCGLVGSLSNDAVTCPALSQCEQDGAAGRCRSRCRPPSLRCGSVPRRSPVAHRSKPDS